MKAKITLLFFLNSLFALSQVGINTANPQGIFNVDGAKDNVLSGTPSTAQQLNDFSISSSGNVGIGTTAPSARLEINNGSTNGAIKIVDGTQGVNKVLMSDANGLGTWQGLSSIKSTVTGTFPSPQISTNSDGGTAPKYTGVYIDLAQGRYVINAGLTFFNYSGTRYWLHPYLSTSTTSIQQVGFIHQGPAGANTSYAGVMSQSGTSGNDNTLNFIVGSSVINVTASTLRIYLIVENRPTNYWTYPSGAQENFLYAVPIQ